MTNPEQLSTEEVEAIDRQYRPFPPFDEWKSAQIDSNLWSETIDLLEEARRQLSTTALKRAHERVMRAAAVTSGAIEGLYEADRGFTITVAEQAAAWQHEIAQHGPKARDLFEAQMEAYGFAVDAATKRFPISQAWIRSLHEILTGPQDTYTVLTATGPQEQPLPRGQYKLYPNHVTLPDGTYHAYAPVSETQSEMTRLADALNSPEFNNAHPILQCSYSHYAIAAIHPFADGNGRVARALASVWLLRELSIPLVIFTEEKGPYLRSLRAADEQNRQPFVDFVSGTAADSVMLTLEMIERSKIPDLNDSVADLQSLVTFEGDIGYEQMDRFAQSLVEALSIEVASVSGQFSLPSGIQFSAGLTRGNFAAPPIAGFRTPGGLQQLALQMGLNVPYLGMGMNFTVLPYVSTNHTNAFPLVLGLHGEALMRFRISEVRSGVSVSARLRLASLAEQLISRLLSLTDQMVRRALGI